MSTASNLIDTHLKIWSDTNRDRRRESINELYAENCKVYDPFYPDVFVGRDALMTLIDEVQLKFPGFAFSIISGSLDEHHGAIKLSWFYGPAENPKAITGQDFFLIEDDLISSLYIFIEKLAD
ncbi:nuclear transport factor 2 family protein [Paenibacillus psychroresistens]|uniref:Nuclear transport factor 2 family protein n=1 Tax=Paenibacillus psychroresistens TaxID=1778678 RepID=A0A6B8RTY1_9BACL|nr:nuclear transport factor 2 family protein [Paenibacillus psychroresistens]QGQ98766.1 nuclear transport factor 2 family protein [Paenibacillus psychroresistens]